jgi:hypothetical protein
VIRKLEMKWSDLLEDVMDSNPYRVAMALIAFRPWVVRWREQPRAE